MRFQKIFRSLSLLSVVVTLAGCPIIGTSYKGGPPAAGVVTNGGGSGTGSTGSNGNGSSGGSTMNGGTLNPASFVTVTGPMSGTAGECVPASFTIAGKDTAGNPSQPFASGTVFTVSDSSGGTISNDASCRNVVTSFNAPTDSNTINFWVRGAKAGNYVIHVTSSRFAAVDSDITYSAGPPARVKLDLTSSASVFTCVPFTVRVLDGLEELALSRGEIPLHFAKSNGERTGIYDIAGCAGTPTSDVTLATGVVTKQLFIFGNDATEVTVSVTPPAPVAGDTQKIAFLAQTSPKIAVAGPAGNTPAGDCATFTLSINVGGPLFPVRVPTTINLETNADTRTTNVPVVYNGPGCAGAPMRSVTLATGASSLQFSVRDNVAEELTVSGASAGFISGNTKATWLASTPYEILMTGVPGQIRASACSARVTVKLIDRFGNIAKAAARTTIGLAGTTNGAQARVKFSLAADCSDTVTSTAIENGETTGSYYFTAIDPGPLKIEASASDLKSAFANTSVDIASGYPKKLVIVGPADQLRAGDCGIFTVYSQDGNGNPLQISPTDLVLAGSTTSATGIVYSKTNCTGDGTVTIAAGQTSASFGLRDPKAEDITLSLRDTTQPSLASVSLLVHVIPNIAKQLRFINPPTAVVAGQCYTATIAIYDGLGNATVADGLTNIRLDKTKPTTFSNGLECAGSTTTTAIENTKPSVTFSFRPDINSTGEVTLYGIGPVGISAAFLDLDITAPEQLHLKLAADSTSFAAGTCQRITLSSLGPAEQLLIYNAFIASLTSTASVADIFYSNGDCSTKLTPAQVTLSATNNPAELWVKTTHAETFQVKADAPGLSASLQLTVNPATATTLFLSSTGPGSFQVNTWAGPYSAELRDTYGNNVKPSASVGLTLSTASSAGLQIAANTSGAGAVSIGAGQPSASFFLFSDSAGQKSFSLVGNGFTSSSRTVQVLDVPPTVTSVSPTFGSVDGGTDITITGDGFLASPMVKVGNNACTNVQVVSPQSIKCKTPGGPAGPADVSVANQNSSPGVLPGGFTYLRAAPTIGSVSPTSGPTTGGIPLTIAGSGFSNPQVKVGTKSCPIVSATATQIICTLPEGDAPGTVTISVVNTNPLSFPATVPFEYKVPGPTVSGFSPTSGLATVTTEVTITGSGFQQGATVTNCNVISITATVIKCGAPPHAAGTVTFTVSNPNSSPTTVGTFTYLNAPAQITDFSPKQGPKSGDTVITITGSNFDPQATVSSFCTLVSVTATEIKCKTIAHDPGGVLLEVTNPGAQAVSAGTFTFLNPSAVVTGFSPTHGPAAGETIITIDGSGFVGGATISSFCTLVSLTATQIKCKTIAGNPGDVTLTVTNPGSLATTVGTFHYDNPPATISSFSPSSGPASGGTQVTIVGTGFLVGTTVDIGGDCPVVSITPTKIICNIPVSAHTVGLATVSVTVPQATAASATDKFRFLAAAPTLAGYLAPNSGSTLGGTVVDINGSGFIADANTVVKLGGVPCTVTSITTTKIRCTTGARAAGQVALEITNLAALPLLVNNAYLYTNPVPLITSFSPNVGPAGGGIDITFNGSGFAAGITVLFGTNSCPIVGTLTSTQLTCRLPAGAAGAVVTITITNTYAAAGVQLVNAFRYLTAAPTVSSVSPASGPLAGTNTATVYGSGFLAGATVTFGTKAATVQTVTATTIVVTVPAGLALGAVDVKAKNTYSEEGVKQGAYTYLAPAPQLLTFTPASGPVEGGNTLTIGGAGFTSYPTVAVGGRLCPIASYTASQIVCTVPAGLVLGPVAVTVTLQFSYTASTANAYQYVSPAPVVSTLTPRSGPTSGGTILSITGSGFVPGQVSVTVAGLVCSILGSTLTTISCATPPHAAGTFDVVVKNTYSYAQTLAGYFTYVVPPRQSCAIFVQQSRSCGDTHQYEFSFAWIPTPSGLPIQNGIATTQVTPFVGVRTAAALFSDVCHRAPAAIYNQPTTYTGPYPSTLNVGGLSYGLMTNGNVGSPDCQAFFSQYYSPLILDMKNQGILLSAPNAGVKFNIANQGPQSISWPTNPESSMFLVLDANRNGNIDGINEMFGNNTIGPDNQTAANGFEALAKYDDNHDGYIDSRDSIFSELRLWSDKNRNGRVEAGELLSLASQGVKRIDLHYLNVRERNDFYGNETLQRSIVETTTGGMIKIFDLWFVPGRGN